MDRTLASDKGSNAGVSASIERQRLVARLHAGAAYPITLLIAPAGYGKSIVLRQYLKSLREPNACFALRAEHAELLGFLRGFSEALQGIAPHAITTLAGAYERNSASPKRGADLARWMDAHLESFTGLIAVDDLHIADGEPEVTTFLSSLIEQTKERVRWILASRSKAGLPVTTWQAYHDADIPIDERDLRFTLDEARETALGFGLMVRDEELADLLALTEGWPAAMSFALRTSTRSSELRNVSAITREMIYRLLAEQVYTRLDDVERRLLEVAIALPVIDISVLERAGFDSALAILERLRERTSFIYEESSGIYHCHDLFRDFLRHQNALAGRRLQQSAHERAADALEKSGDVEHAIAAYALAACARDVVRLLEESGFDLLERARGDVVARAIETLDERTRHENATILALQGVLHAIAGKFARAESLLRRALARTGNNLDLVATASLRLASLIANQGGDATDLLRAVGNDARQSTAHRAEALSVIAGQQAVAADFATAQVALAGLEPLLHEFESDAIRAKVLHHLGIAFHHLGVADRAFDVLTQSREVASELHLYGLASRTNAVLSNLALHEEDDVVRQQTYAESAAAAATRAGDNFALQTALLQMLSAEMRLGDLRSSIEIEQRLASISTSETTKRYLALFRSERLAWEGRFSEAHQLMASCWTKLAFDFDRIASGSEYALFLALDGQRQPSGDLVREILRTEPSTRQTGLGRIRSTAIAKALCALAEAVNGRTTRADRILKTLRSEGDSVVALTVGTVDAAIFRLRFPYQGEVDQIEEGLKGLAALGYIGLGHVLRAADRTLRHAQPTRLSRANLTPTEIQILGLLAEGLVPKDIATRTGRSVHTVRVHITNVIAKLNCHGSSEAIQTAKRMGLLANGR
ncbi:MAG: LuxR C-terminal-related transcriptional regulator [Candidatus Cybelea sp.]